MATKTHKPPSFDEFKARAIKQMAGEEVQLSDEQLRSTYDRLYPNAEAELSAPDSQDSAENAREAKSSISQESLNVIDRLNTLAGLIRALWTIAGLCWGLFLGFSLGAVGVAVGLILGGLIGFSVGSLVSVFIDFCRRVIELLDKIASK